MLDAIYVSMERGWRLAVLTAAEYVTKTHGEACMVGGEAAAGNDSDIPQQIQRHGEISDQSIMLPAYVYFGECHAV